ncbi:hypothetical protein WJR50_33825 [Catalinimonas sp. 4WD22]|uniref:hypothetical protein n=1 Tax=Catalinimonas locisalis TaxID=3133978 RepID=UPI003100B70E
MKAFWKWVIRNLSNIFGFIGILLTLYFGVFYIPSWLRETQNERFINAQRELQQSIKELIYSDSLCTYSEIEILIKAKELTLSHTFPLTPEQVLTRAQESFMLDRFLPLKTRKNLISELESIKKQIPKPSEEQIIEAKKDSIWVLQLISIAIAILSGIVGIFSFYSRYRTEKEKDEEIENQSIETDHQKSSTELAFDYENQIAEIIQNYPGTTLLRTPKSLNSLFDLEFEFEDRKYFIEAKYLTKSKVGLNSFRGFLARQKGLEGEFWFVYNTGLTEMVKRMAREINKQTSSSRKVVLIHAESGIDFRNKIEKILPVT